MQRECGFREPQIEAYQAAYPAHAWYMIVWLYDLTAWFRTVAFFDIWPVWSEVDIKHVQFLVPMGDFPTFIDPYHGVADPLRGRVRGLVNAHIDVQLIFPCSVLQIEDKWRGADRLAKRDGLRSRGRQVITGLGKKQGLRR